MRNRVMQQIPAQVRFPTRCRRAWSAIGRFIAARLFAKTRSGTGDALKVEEKLTLGPKKMLYLVNCREREFLVAASADAIVSMLEVQSFEQTSLTRTSRPRVQKCERLAR